VANTELRIDSMAPESGVAADCFRAVHRLYDLLCDRFWNGKEYVGPDPGVRLNFRVWRFVKSHLAFVGWHDECCYMQTQGYCVKNNWRMYELFADARAADIAVDCAFSILNRQRPEGYWDYPSREWAGRIGTVEGTWAAVGMLASYERTKDEALRKGILKWYEFLVNDVGFQKTDAGMGINYYANRDIGLVPNNSTLALAFFGELARVMEDTKYLRYCSEMISFLGSVQTQTGEFPYVVESPLGRGRLHYQCYQYHAFQLLDMAAYFNATQDSSVLPLIEGSEKFLSQSVKADGHTQYACHNSHTRVVYHTAAIGAALSTARRLDVGHSLAAENRAYEYVLSKQNRDGGFPVSEGDYYFLGDTRYYPRYLGMILYHLLARAGEMDKTH
jgi:hypothetical protein